MSTVEHPPVKETIFSLKRKYNEDDRSYSVSSIVSLEENLDDKLDNESTSANSDAESESSATSDEDHSTKKRRVTEESTTEVLEETLELTLPATQKAIVITSLEEPFQIHASHPVPTIAPHEVLIENKFIGLNPVDWKGKKYRFGIYSFPWIQGRESSGIIQAIGADVKGFKVGDEVFMASTSYRELKTSTFQEYTVFDARLVWKKPEDISLKECGGIGVGLVTASSVMEELGVGLFNENDSEENNAKGRSILVWGASSGVGSYVVQLARIAGYEKIIAVSSLKHETALRNSGATHVLDRFKTKEELKKELEELTPEGVHDGVDVVSKETTDIVVELLNVNKEKHHKEKNLVAVVSSPSKAIAESLLEGISVKTVLIKKFHEDIEHGVRLVKRTYELLTSGDLKPQRNIKLYNGVDGVLKGLEDLETYGASFEKYVVEL